MLQSISYPEKSVTNFFLVVLISSLKKDSNIQKTKKQYLDSRKSNMTKINTELQEVHKIMVQNIEDVLQRGAALSSKIQAQLFWFQNN